MTTIPSIFIEMDVYGALYDPDGLVISDPDGLPINVMSGWGDITEDIRQSVPVMYTSGNQGHAITDRVADEGVLTLAFDNSAANSAGLAGYYSPDSGNVRPGFAQDVPIRIRLASGTVNYYQWNGVIATIQPDSGIYGRRITMVEAVDYMHYLTETDFTGVNVQVDKKDDQLLTTLIAGAPVAPAGGMTFDVGDDIYTYAFHDEITGTSRLATVIQKLMMSGLGKFYVRGDTSTGEVLRYITRSKTLLTTTPVAILDNTMLGVDVIRDDTSRIKKVNVITYPVQIDTVDVVLWQLNKEITLTHGQSLTFTMYLRDPAGRAKRVAAASMAAILTTDYSFSSTSGSGSDLNAYITFSYSAGADAIDVTVTNTHAATTGYLWMFKPCGKGIYLYEPTTISKLTGQTAGRNMNVNMVYQDDVWVGADIATLLSTWYAVPLSSVSAVKFMANRSDALMTAALTVQPGDYIVLKETQTGIDGGFIVNGITKDIRLGGSIIYCNWHLAPANLLDAFILDISKLDVGKLGA